MPRPGFSKQADLARDRREVGRRDQVLDEKLMHDLVALGEVGGAQAEVVLGDSR